MQITIFSVWMTFVWCSIFIVLCYILRKRSVLLNLSSMTGIIILYLFCLIRLAVPVELPWTKVVSGGSLYNFLYQIFGCEITCVAGHEIYVYHIFVVAMGSGHGSSSDAVSDTVSQSCVVFLRDGKDGRYRIK